MKIIELDLNNLPKYLEITEDCTIKGRFLLKKDQILVSKIHFVHKLPNLKSNIDIKAIVLDSAKFDMECDLTIEKGATLTDTYLKLDCLIMGDSANARAVPSLEILESEVKGGHGATVGYIDQNQIFYLESKGIDRNMAEKLLMHAFLFGD